MIDPKCTAKKELKFKDPAHPNETYYSVRYEGTHERDEIREFCQSKSDQLKEKSPNSSYFIVSLKYADGQWRSGKRRRPGDPVSIWDPSDSPGFIDLGDIIGFDIIFTIPKEKEKEKILECKNCNEKNCEEKEEEYKVPHKKLFKKISTK